MKTVTQPESEPIEIFTSLGLTSIQAKVYLALVKLGEPGGDIKSIFRESKIVRQDIYRVLPTLQKMGLVEKIIEKPIVYRAIPIEEGFSALLDKKSNEFKELEKKAKVILEKASIKSNNRNAIYDEGSRFIITYEKGLFLKKMVNDIEEAQSSIKMMYSKERMSLLAFHATDQLKKAMSKGVKIRALTENMEKEDKHIQTLKKNPSFKLKFTKDIEVGLIIIDDKEVNIRISSTLVPNLLTNNRNVVKIADIYFEDCWKNAQ